MDINIPSTVKGHERAFLEYGQGEAIAFDAAEAALSGETDLYAPRPVLIRRRYEALRACATFSELITP